MTVKYNLQINLKTEICKLYFISMRIFRNL
jgi:hypothetical protein